jgi:hypothetical protein
MFIVFLIKFLPLKEIIAMYRVVAIIATLLLLFSFKLGFASSGDKQSYISLINEQNGAVISVKRNKMMTFPRFYFDAVEKMWSFSFPKHTFSFPKINLALSGGNIRIAFLENSIDSDCLKVVVKKMVEPLIELSANELRIKFKEIGKTGSAEPEVPNNSLIKPDQRKFETINLTLNEGVSEDLLLELAKNAGINLNFTKVSFPDKPISLKASSAREALKIIAQKTGMKIEELGNTWLLTQRSLYGKK